MRLFDITFLFAFLGLPLGVLGQVEIAILNQPSILSVKVTAEEKEVLGSGFFVGDDLVATNWHVVREADSISLSTSDGKKTSGRVWVASPEYDLAIIKVDQLLGVGRIVQLRSSPAQELEPIFVCGHPEAMAFSWSSGSVANAHRLLTEGAESAPKCELIQFNAAISHGSSGGPMFDAKGKVLGVITGCWMEGQNLNFAVPTERLQVLLEKAQNIYQARQRAWESMEWKKLQKTLKTRTTAKEKKEAAEAFFKKHGPYAMVYLDYGTSLYQSGDYLAAQKLFKKALSLEPGNGRVWLALGLVRMKEKDVKESYSAFCKAVQFAADDQDLVVGVSKGMVKVGERDEAEKTLKEALQRHPDWVNARQDLEKLSH